MRDLLLVLFLLSAACSSDVFTEKGTDGGGKGFGLPGTSSDAGKTSDGKPDAPAASCDSRLSGTTCAQCMGASCCSITKQCLDDPGCYGACIDPGDSCTSNGIGSELVTCASAHCAEECK